MNKSKLLSAFLAVIMLVTTCCSTFVLNVGADDVTPVYYIQGGGTGDGRSESSPAGTMTQIIASITADNYNVAGQNVTVKVMAGDSKAYYQSGSESYTYDATITFEGYNNEVTAFVSKDSSNKVLVYGPSVFKNIKFYSPAASGDFELNCNGLNVTLENVYFAFSGGNTPNIGNVYIHQGNLRAYGPKGNGGVVTVDSATMSRAGTIGSSGYYDNSSQKYNNTYSEDVKVVLYSGTLNNLRFNSSKTGYPSVFNKNVNFVLNGTTVSALHNRNYQDTMGGVLQIIYNNGATINGTAGGYEVTVPRYDIYVENINGAALDTTETAGTYSITFPEGKDIAKAYLLDSDGNKTETVYTNSGSTITVGDPGKYSVVFEKTAEEDTNPDEYFLKGGATGSGRTAGDAAGTMTALVQSIKDDGNNIAGKKITVKVINASENTGFGEANALYYNPYSYSDSSSTYSTVITHDATLVFESYDANSRGCLWTADATKYYFDYIRIGGPTVFRGIDIKINRASGSWFEMFCNGYDVTFDDVIFRLKDGSQSAVSNTIIHQGSWFHNNGSRLGGGGTITVDATTLTRLSYVNASGNMNENNDWYFTSGNQSFTDEVKIVIDKGTLSKELRIGGSYSGKEITYGDNLNIILNGTAVATMFSRNVVNIADGCAMQIIYNNGASISKQTTASGCTFPSTRYDIYVENINGAALDTTETAGTYSITFPAGKTVAVAQCGDNLYYSNGNTITVGEAGTYNVRFLEQLPNFNPVYYLKGGAENGDGSYEAPFKELSQIIDAIKEASVDVKDTVVTVKIINSTENTGFEEDNALYINPYGWKNGNAQWGIAVGTNAIVSSVLHHNATIVFESATDDRAEIFAAYGSDRYCALRLGGPTVLRNIDLKINRASGAYPLFATGYDLELDNVKFFYSDGTEVASGYVEIYKGAFHSNQSGGKIGPGGLLIIDQETLERTGCISPMGWTPQNENWVIGDGYQNLTEEVKLIINGTTANKIIFRDFGGSATASFGDNVNIILNGTTVTNFTTNGAPISIADGKALQVIYNGGATITNNKNIGLTRYDIFVENINGASLDTTDVAGTYTVTFPEGKTTAYAYLIDANGKYAGGFIHESVGNTLTVGKAGTYTVVFEYPEITDNDPMEYFLMGGATGSGRTAITPAGTMQDLVDSVEADGYNVEGTEITVKLINAGENTGYGEANALYYNPKWYDDNNSKLIIHKATFIYENFDDEDAGFFWNAKANKSEWKALRISGPSVFRGINFRVTTDYYKVFCNGFDTTFEDVYFRYSDGSLVPVEKTIIHQGVYEHNGGGALIDDGYLVDGQGLKGGTITVDAATTNRVGYIVASGDATWAHRSGWQNFTDDVKLVIGASTINNALCISNMSVQDADITFGKNINLVLNGTTVTTLASKTAITALGEGNALQIIYNNGATVVTDNVADLLTRYDIFVAEGGALDTTAVAGTYAITLPEGMKYAYAYAGDGEYDGTSAIWYGTDTITVGNAGKYQVRFTASLNDIISEDNFGGWLKQSDGTVIPHFEHENASLINILGTQLRLKDDKKDLRFIVEITKSDLKNVFGISGHNSENPDFGCIIVPESLIGEGCTFTSEHEDAAEVPAHVLFDETKQYYRYTVCLTDIADVNKVYVVKGYVDTADGRVESFSYGTSLYAVAKAAYDAHNDPDDYRKLSYTELEAVESILANG